jgi:hypothetical protein
VLGRALGRIVAAGDSWYSLCLADDDIEATAARLGLAVEAGSRTLPDGQVIAWRAAGIDDPHRSLGLPFFIDWRVAPGLHPGALPHGPGGATPQITAVEIGGDENALREWIGQELDRLPIRTTRGPSGIRAVKLSAAGSTIWIE